MALSDPADPSAPSHIGPPRSDERALLLALERAGCDAAGADLFDSAALPSALLRLYGGQAVAQALWAAQTTVEQGRRPANCHACFLAPGMVDEPIRYAVTRDADGRSFAIRRITARQGNRLILTMTATFHVEEHGPRAQIEMPDIAPPEDLPDMETLLRAAPVALPERHRPFWLRDHMFEWRPAEPFRTHDRPSEPGPFHFWVRLKEAWNGPQGSEPALLAYMSDLHLLHSGLAPLGVAFADERLQTASLDHSVWFHEPASLDQWLLYRVASPHSGHALALGQGDLFTRDGTLVATTAQQGLIRLLDTPRKDIL